MAKTNEQLEIQRLELKLKRERENRRNLEDQYEQNKFLLQTAKEENERLVFQVTHDLRAPITALSQSVEDILPLLSLEKRSLFLSTVARVQDISHQVLATHRDGKGTFEVNFTKHTVDVVSHTSAIVEEKKMLLKEKANVGIELNFNGLRKNKELANIRDMEFDCILSNILVNSVEAIEERGIEGLIHIEVKKETDQYLFKITDNGIGIKEKDLEKIGKYRVTLKKKGNGIGLYNSIHFLSKRGGTFKLESERGVGTTIYFTIPVPHMNKKGCFHTHVLFCTVSDEGKRLIDKGINRRRWNKVCDKKSREHGLSTVERTTSKQRERLSRSAHKIMRKNANREFKKMPYQLQIMQKADFARRIATNMNKFVELMQVMGVEVRIRGKETISYVHDEEKKPTRGRTIGLNYKIGGLNETFKKNATEFKSRPKLETSLEEKLRTLVDDRGNVVGDTSDFPFHPGGHQEFTKAYGGEQRFIPSLGLEESKENHLADAIFHAVHSSLIFAQSQSIPEYCKRNGIALNQNEDGSHTLRGREHILIRGTEWENIKIRNGKKVGTKGSLIEFVANYKKMSIMESLAEITGNKRLLLLQQYLGKEERKFQEFHVPRQNLKSEKEAVPLLGKLLAHFGHKSEISKFMYQMKQVQVRTDGVIRFLAGEKAKGAIEFKQDKKGNWQKQLLGNLHSGIFKQSGTGNKMKLFKDPFCFMNETEGKGKMAFKTGENLLVLGENSFEALDIFLANNTKVSHVELFGFESKELSKTHFLGLKKHGITFQFMESNTLQRDKGLDLTR